MNSRAVELYKQAVEFAYQTAGNDAGKGTIVESLTAGKFAELIVRECIEQGKQVQSQPVSNGSEEYVVGREMGIEVYMNQIKQHFGFV